MMHTRARTRMAGNGNYAPPCAPMRPLAELIDAITEQATRLRPPSSGQPHAFHEDKSELVGALRRLAREARR
ncbi:hypothetical protein ACQW02_25665 [Humitalea sp. 24SJ18S-53]|uniref:hypothetical protein n=1 Tax=Humitalea sp. 24SJ18S-53 TaxID=3422307 RepID=UPI003D67E2E1